MSDTGQMASCATAELQLLPPRVGDRFLCGGKAPGPRRRAGGQSLVWREFGCPGFTNADFHWNGAVA